MAQQNSSGSDGNSQVSLISAGDATGIEGHGVVIFTVTRAGDTSGEASVDYKTFDISAEAGKDYTAVEGVLHFAANETSKDIIIPTGDDNLCEKNESFKLLLSNPINSSIEKAVGTATIIDDEVSVESLAVEMARLSASAYSDTEDPTLSQSERANAALPVDRYGDWTPVRGLTLGSHSGVYTRGVSLLGASVQEVAHVYRANLGIGTSGEAEGTLVIAFRGTDEGPLELIADAISINALAESMSDVMSGVQSYLAENSITKVVLTGHSLGGGIAEYWGFHCAEWIGGSVGADDVQVITFGSPGFEAGEGADSSDLACAVTRITHASDLVPAVGGLRYDQLGAKLLIDRADLGNVSPTTETMTAIENLGRSVFDPGTEWEIGSHTANEYVRSTSAAYLLDSPILKNTHDIVDVNLSMFGTLYAMHSGTNQNPIPDTINGLIPETTLAIIGLQSDDVIEIDPARITDIAVNGLAGDDSIRGASHNDYLMGGDGNDSLFGGDGDDSLEGGAGDDELYGDGGNDTLDGGDGFDFVGIADNKSSYRLERYNGIVYVHDRITGETQQLVNVEGLGFQVGGYVPLAIGVTGNWRYGTPFADTITGTSGDDGLFGDEGADILLGGAGRDYFHAVAGDGDDTLDGGDDKDFAGYQSARAGHTIAQLDDRTFTVTTTDGAIDTLVDVEAIGFTDGYVGLIVQRFDNADGSTWNQGTYRADSIAGTNGVDGLRGGEGDDTLAGGAGRDYLEGEDGADRLDGGADNDYAWYGAARADHTLARQADGSVTVTHTVSGEVDTLVNVEAVGFTDAAVVIVQAQRWDNADGSGWWDGSVFADTIIGGAATDGMDGSLGADILLGGGANDFLSGGEGDDTLAGEAGDDYLLGGAGADLFRFDAGSGFDRVGDFDFTGGDRLGITAGMGWGAFSNAEGAWISFGAQSAVLLAGIDHTQVTAGWFATV